MSLGDFFPVDPGSETVVARRYQTLAGATAINPGEFVIQDTAGDAEYVQPPADGASNTATWVGVAATLDTVTAGADGVVYVYDNSTYQFRGKATTPANLTTANILTQVTLDVTAGAQTVDENDTTNGTLRIMNINADDGTVDVQMSKADHISEG